MRLGRLQDQDVPTDLFRLNSHERPLFSLQPKNFMTVVQNFRTTLDRARKRLGAKKA